MTSPLPHLFFELAALGRRGLRIGAVTERHQMQAVPDHPREISSVIMRLQASENAFTVLTPLPNERLNAQKHALSVSGKVCFDNEQSTQLPHDHSTCW